MEINGKINTEKKRYYSIDIMKLICACLVVGVHAQLFSDINRALGEVVTGTFGRMCVPFFACVSGYFFIKAEAEGKNPLKRQIKSLIKYYLIFSLFYIIWEFFKGSFSAMSSGMTVMTILKRFFLYGTYYHLWFFPCMILSLIVIHFAVKYHMMTLLAVFSFAAYIFAAFTYGWNGIGQMFIPGFGRLMEWFDFDYIRRFAGLTLPLAVLGMFIIHTCAFWKDKRHDRILWIGWLISITADTVETAFVLKTGIAEGTTVTFALMPVLYFTFMLGLRYPMKNREQVGKFCRNASIVMYGLHPLFLEVLEIIFKGMITPTVCWGIVVIFCVLISYVGQILLKEVPGRHDLKKR